MKNIREAVHDVIAQRVLPWIERDGISKLLLPEQITQAHCATPMRCERPCYLRYRGPILGIGLTGKAPHGIDGKTFIFTRGRMVLLPGGTDNTSVLKYWRRNENLNPGRSPSILWMLVYPFGIRVQISHIAEEEDATETSRPYMLLGRHFNRLINNLLEEVQSRSPHYATIGRGILTEFMGRCLRSASAAASVDILDLPPSRRPFGKWFTPKSHKGLPKKNRRDKQHGKLPPRQPPSRVQVAQEFIYYHYHMPINLDDIAEAAESSVNHLIRQFKTVTGLTPIAYLLQVRMAAARQLLLTDLKVSEVSRLIGIEDAFYFSRLFRRETGANPLAYRRRMSKSTRTPHTPRKSTR